MKQITAKLTGEQESFRVGDRVELRANYRLRGTIINMADFNRRVLVGWDDHTIGWRKREEIDHYPF